jgi:hypothetical protein
MRDMAAFEGRKARRAKVVASWYSRNKPAKLVTDRRWRADAKKTKPLYKLGRRMRNRVATMLKRRGLRKCVRTVSYLGCTVTELKLHIEKQFQPGMSWDNYGPTWHVDHDKPLASATSPEELMALCHFTNLRPLWAWENLSKGAKCLTR